MKKLLTILILFIAYSAAGQSFTVNTQVKHSDTLFLKTITYTYHFDSTLKYVAKQYFQGGDTSVIIYDTTWYYQRFRVIDSQVEDSSEVNHPNIRQQLRDTADALRTQVVNALGNKLSIAAAASTYEPIISSGTASQYFKGDKTLATFPTTTASFSNSTNKNFVTDAQATVIGNTSGTNTGDNATNSQYSGLAASKQNVITTGTTLQYFRGDLSLATFPTTTAPFANSTDKNFVTDAKITVLNNTSGTNTGDQTSVSGNAGTATTLATPRTINGVSFNGSANITVPSDIAASTSGNVLTSNGTVWTSAARFPQQVATADIVATANATNTTTLFTPSADGMYRISVYMKITVTGTSPVAGPVTITYTDADGSVAQSHVMALTNVSGAIVTTTVNNSTTTGTVTGTMIVMAKSGVAIQYAIAVSGTFGSGRYTAHLTCERVK